MNNNLDKILIVDDDENICEVIKYVFKWRLMITRKCNNGKEACNLFTEYKPIWYY